MTTIVPSVYAGGPYPEIVRFAIEGDRIVTEAGIAAIDGLLASGINVNITLISSLRQYEAVMRAFRDSLVILLLIATAISAVLWLYERDSALPYEALTILGIVVLNAIMSLFGSR